MDETFDAKLSLEDMDVDLNEIDELLDGLFYIEDDATAFLQDILLKFISEEEIDNFDINFSIKEEFNNENELSFKIDINIEQIEETEHLYKTLLKPVLIKTKNTDEFLNKISEQVNSLSKIIEQLFLRTNTLTIG